MSGELSRAGFARDLSAVSLRALRGAWRERWEIIPSLFIPLFFFVVNIGSLQSFVEGNIPADFDFKGFQLPVSLIFAVTGVTRANALVIDIQDGYFDRLLLTPVNRATLLLGLMVADIAVALFMCIPVIVLGLAVGVDFATGAAGMVAFLLIGALWGFAFTGFPYAIALKTGSPAAVNLSFLLFFPFAFLTSAYIPQDLMTGWLGTAADYNPVTYLLAGMRALVMEGWQARPLVEAFAALGAVAALSFSLASLALRGRLRRR